MTFKRFPPIYNLSSQIQNASKLGLKRIAVPYSNTNKTISLILLDEGLLSNVATGDIHGPFTMNFWNSVASDANNAKSTPSHHEPATSRAPSHHEPSRSNVEDDETTVDFEKLNVGKRRLWLDLKYRHGVPALSKMACISKPSRRVFASIDECRAIASARQAGSLLKGQVLGQVTILNTPYGIVEMKQALLKGVGGEVLCYAA